VHAGAAQFIDGVGQLRGHSRVEVPQRQPLRDGETQAVQPRYWGARRAALRESVFDGVSLRRRARRRESYEDFAFCDGCSGI
jgi:hypothetical protein